MNSNDAQSPPYHFEKIPLWYQDNVPIREVGFDIKKQFPREWESYQEYLEMERAT